MRTMYQWLRDFVIVVREIAKAVAYSRSHPSEPPKHEDK